MKSILIINFFHSSVKQAGAIRTQRFARFLPQFGWKPYIITKPFLNEGRITEVSIRDNTFYVPSVSLNKPFRLEVFIWIPFMVAKAIRLIQKHRVDVVLISCPPFHPALAGILLKKWFNVQLVVDYRDAWSLNPYYQGVDRFHQFILKGDKVLENFLLHHTDLLIVSHQTMKENYLRQFSFLKDSVEVIYNGFDPENIEGKEETLFPKFTILHLGDFYARQKTRDPSLFLASLKNFISQEKIPPEKLEVQFVGEIYEEIGKTILTLGLSSYVSCQERIPYDMAVRYLNKSHLLLLIETRDVMTTKVFEYLATGKPILALIKEGELKNLIEKYSRNSYVFTNPDFNQIITAIMDCYQSYESHHVEPSESFISNFNRQNQTKQLALCLNKLIRK
jgi:glycosyltransferase involved in cell wall biosynthesis